MKTIAVIPARSGSKRLARKNIHPVFGKPMLVWSIEACARCQNIDEIYVSTEDDEIAEIAMLNGANVITRPENLADDVIPKMEVIRHADKWYKNTYGSPPKVLVSVQANSPELKSHDIDRGIEMLITNDLYEVISVGSDMIQNASFRVIRQTSLYNTFLSAHLGVVVNDCLDVHTLADVESIEANYKDIAHFTQRINQ